MSDDAVPVALVYPTDSSGAQLRDALTRCGTPIVYETLTSSADRDSLEQSGARVVVVNLDADVDRYLDDIQSLLAGCDCRIVFNDSQVTGALTGWDEARWMRHLAAKIRGQEDSSPPRPAGAKPVPTRADISQNAHAALGRDGSTRELPGVVAADEPGTREDVAELAAIEPDAIFVVGELDIAIDGAALAPDVEMEPDEPILVPRIEAREVEASEAPDFSGWSIEELEDEPVEAPVDTPNTQDFGVDIIDPAEYLAPTVGSPTHRASGAADLELIPLDFETLPAPVSPDHENWFDAAVTDVGASFNRVWVLAAATGGPQAVRDALKGLPADYPDLFLLALQMGEDFIDVMLDQLAGSTALRVRHAVSGEHARRGDVLVVTEGQTVSLDRSGAILTHAGSACVPTEQLLRDVTAEFGARSGAIVFSGVSIGLLDALNHMRANGGEVWVQDPATCLVGALAEAAAEGGVATFVGAPGELAERLLAHASGSDLSKR